MRQLARRSARPRQQLAAAIGADTAQPVLRTRRAKRALKRTDARLGGRGRQIAVAAFAVGAELEHGAPFVNDPWE